MSERSYKAIKILTFIPLCVLGIFLLLLLGEPLVKNLDDTDTIKILLAGMAAILLYLIIPCFVMAAAGLVASVAAKINGYSNMEGYIIYGIISVLLLFQPILLCFIMGF